MKFLALIVFLLGTTAFSQTVITPSSGDIAGPLNTALASCPSAGCDLEIAPFTGTVTLNAPVLIAHSNVKIHCDAQTTMFTNYSGPVSMTHGYWPSVIDIYGSSNVEFNGCNIDVSTISTGVAAIHVFGSSNVLVHNNTITSTVAASISGFGSTPLGIRVEGASGQLSTNVQVYNNTITVPSIGLSSGLYSQHLNYYSNNVTNTVECVDLNGAASATNPVSSDIDFHDNVCTTNLSSSYVESAAYVRIHDNTFWQDATNNTEAIAVHNTLPSNFLLQVDISNNLFVGSDPATGSPSLSTGYAAHFFQNVGEWSFSHNRVIHMLYDGLLVDSTSGTPGFGEIIGNRFISNGQAGASGGYCGIRLHQSSGNNVGWLSISNNEFIDVYNADPPTEQYPVCSDGGQAPFFIRYTGNFVYLPNDANFPAGCSDCVIANNPFD
jgi:hypothetical protein